MGKQLPVDDDVVALLARKKKLRDEVIRLRAQAEEYKFQLETMAGAVAAMHAMVDTNLSHYKQLLKTLAGSKARLERRVRMIEQSENVNGQS